MTLRAVTRRAVTLRPWLTAVAGCRHDADQRPVPGPAEPGGRRPRWRRRSCCWPRVAGHKASHAAARTGLLIATQLTAIVAVLGGLNAYFSFIVSWSDLVGTHASTTLQSAHGKAHAAVTAPIIVTRTQIAAVTRRATHTATHTPATPSAHPTQRRVQRARRACGRGSRRQWRDPDRSDQGRTHRHHRSARSYVYLPPQYFQRAYAHRLFPAVLVLTGYPSDPRSEITRLNLPGAAAAGIAAGQTAANGLHHDVLVGRHAPRHRVHGHPRWPAGRDILRRGRAARGRAVLPRGHRGRRLGGHGRLHRRVLRGEARHDAFGPLHRGGVAVRLLLVAAGLHHRQPLRPQRRLPRSRTTCSGGSATGRRRPCPCCSPAAASARATTSRPSSS